MGQKCAQNSFFGETKFKMDRAFETASAAETSSIPGLVQTKIYKHWY